MKMKKLKKLVPLNRDLSKIIFIHDKKKTSDKNFVKLLNFKYNHNFLLIFKKESFWIFTGKSL